MISPYLWAVAFVNFDLFFLIQKENKKLLTPKTFKNYDFIYLFYMIYTFFAIFMFSQIFTSGNFFQAIYAFLLPLSFAGKLILLKRINTI